MKRLLWILLGSAIALSASAQEISLRHDLDGKVLDALATLVLRFNDELKGKGKSRVAGCAGTGKQGTAAASCLAGSRRQHGFLRHPPAFSPLARGHARGRAKTGCRPVLPQIADAVDDASGRIQALPLGLALPVLMTNRASLRKAGLDPDQPIKTWWELQKVAGEIYDRGGKCPLTTARFAWIHSENVSTQAGEPISSRVGNVDKVLINGMVNVKHLALLASWQKSRYFHYSGPGREGNKRFLSGECAMLTGESSLYAEARRAGIDVGVQPLPHYDDVYAARPADVLPDGAGLWMLAGHKKDEYKLAARFAGFMMRPEVQKEWVQATGYLPMTPGAVMALRDSGIPPQLLDAAQKRLSVSRKGSTRVKHGPIRDRLREFIGEEVALVWTTDRPAKEALDNAVRRVNAAIAPPAKGAASVQKK
jgi:sn-glycerol 3-phosphate transport system substrate-binding protein